MPVRYNLSSVRVRLGIFSQLSNIQCVCMCVFSLPISFVMIERIYILSLIIIIKSEVITITHSLDLGHETMVCAVCLSIFLSAMVMTVDNRVMLCMGRKSTTCAFAVLASYRKCTYTSIFSIFGRIVWAILTNEDEAPYPRNVMATMVCVTGRRKARRQRYSRADVFSNVNCSSRGGECTTYGPGLHTQLPRPYVRETLSASALDLLKVDPQQLTAGGANAPLNMALRGSQTAPAYIHNCPDLMYVKPYLLLRLTCSRWTLNSLLQGGRMHQLDLALRGSQHPPPTALTLPHQPPPPRLPAPAPTLPSTPSTTPSTTPPTAPHTTPPSTPSTTPSTRPHGTTYHTLHRAQRSPQG